VTKTGCRAAPGGGWITPAMAVNATKGINGAPGDRRPWGGYKRFLVASCISPTLVPSKPRRGPLCPRPGRRQEPLRGANVSTDSASWNAQIGPLRRTSAARFKPTHIGTDGPLGLDRLPLT